MEPTQNYGVDSTQGHGVESTQDHGVDSTQGHGVESTQGHGVDSTQGLGVEFSQGHRVARQPRRGSQCLVRSSAGVGGATEQCQGQLLWYVLHQKQTKEARRHRTWDYAVMRWTGMAGW